MYQNYETSTPSFSPDPLGCYSGSLNHRIQHLKFNNDVTFFSGSSCANTTYSIVTPFPNRGALGSANALQLSGGSYAPGNCGGTCWPVHDVKRKENTTD